MDNFTKNKKRSILRSSLLIKLFTILIFSLFAPKAFAQLDVIHYVPPLYAGTEYNGDIGYHWVVLTTPSEEAITVSIKRGNGTLVATVPNVSITTPQRYYFKNETYGNTYGTINRPNLGIINYNGLNKILSEQGLIFTSQNSSGKAVAFYVNIRHKSSIHGLSLTAKGQAALGTSFRSGHLYSVRANHSDDGWGSNLGWIWDGSDWVYDEDSRIVDHRSHFISVMATEDNTQVTFSEIKVGNLTSDTKTALSVSDITSDFATANSVSDFTDDGVFNVILNAGESYVIGANHEFLTAANVNEFNGTKISSDKPIAVNSGSWCGSASTANQQDIGVDQIVPEKLVGDEYILIKGQGTVSASGTERPIVVATEDNTSVYVNGSTSKIATLVNAGDSYAIPTSHFSAEGTMLINTDHRVYMYQTTAASAAKPYPTLGMNFIPPLSALGFRQVDIPFVNELGTGVIAIYAQNGAKVYVNGSSTALDSPVSVTGNDEWVVYSYSTTDNNVTVESDKAIYVAMSVFDNVVGAAGYFSGFTKSISPIDTTVVFNYDLGYICSNRDDKLELAINSKPIPDWYEWYEAKDPTDLLLYKNQDLLIDVSDIADKYILKAYFRDPNMDILYNGDFSIGWGSSLTDLDPFKPSNLETPGKVTLTSYPHSINTRFEDFVDLDGDDGKMLLAHSSGNGANDVIWQQTINSSTDIPGNLFVLKVYGRLAEEGVDQYLDIYVNDDKVYADFQLNDVKKWKSIKAYWKAGTAESAEIRIVDANKNGDDAVFAIDSISFVPAIEATKEFNPDVVPSYTYTPYDKGFHMCEGVVSEILDVSYGNDMEWFTFLWEKGEILPTDTIYVPITDPTIEGLDTYKLTFNNVVDAHKGIYRCTIDFKETYELCGIEAEPIEFLVEVYVDEPASMEPLLGKTELCEGVSTSISTTISGEFSVIEWSVFKEGETTAFETLDNSSSSYDFNYNGDYEVGKYTVRCEVVNGCSDDLFEEINIEIFGRPNLTDLEVPTDLLCVNKSDNLVAVSSTPAGAVMEYSWYRNDVLIETNNLAVYPIVPVLTDTYYKVGVAARYDIGAAEDLVCIGNDKTVTLNPGDIYPEVVLTDLSDVTLCEGKNHLYEAKLATTGDEYIYTYLWETPPAVIGDKNKVDLSLTDITPAMTGDYKVIVTNRCGSDNSTGVLTVLPKVEITGYTTSKAGPYCLNDIVTITINDNGYASGYIATNLRTGATSNIASSPFPITVDESTKGQWEITALNSCGDVSIVIPINLVDSFSAPTVADREACVGDIMTLQAVVTTPPVGTNLSYQWKDQSGNNLDGENSSTLEFNTVKLADAGEYTCVVSDDICSTQEAKGTLSVDDITSVLNPGTANVCEGTVNYRFEISYEGNPTFAWYYKGADNVEQNLASTNSFYEIPTVTTDKDGLYYCLINSACGEERFEQRLNVLKKISVTNDPNVVLDICEGEQTELIINVTGTPNTIKWFNVNNDEMLAYAGRTSIPTGILAPAKTFHYRYEVTGNCDNLSGDFYVVVHQKPSINAIDPIAVCEGDIPLSMTVNGTDYKDPSWFNPDNTDLASGLTATIVDAKFLTSQGNYKAKINSDFCGADSTLVKVSIYEPVTLVSNSELNPHVCVGKSLSLKVDGKGDALSYKWYKGATPLVSTENILDITSAKLSDEGNYRCQLISTCGNIDVDFNVDVRENASVSLLNDVTVCEDDAFAEFSVTGTAEDTPSYKWYNSDGTALTNIGDFSGVLTSTLKIVNVLGHENKSFYCVVSGDYCTSAISRHAKLIVGKNVVITQQPVSLPIQEKGTASFSVDATGTPSLSKTELTYQWFVNTGLGFTSMGNTPASARLKTLVLTDMPLSSNGYKYYCVVSGSCEPATSNPATLTVSADNRITSAIVNAKACEGSSFTFTVEYNDTTDDCTWEYDSGSGYADASGLGSVVNGITSSTLTVNIATTVMETNSWKFRARVLRTGYEPNTSNTATVKVYQQVSFDNIADATLCPNTGESFTVTNLTGTGPFDYEWKKGVTSLGFGSSLNLNVASATDGVYSVGVTNSICTPVVKTFNISHYADLVIDGITDIDPVCENVPEDLVVSITKDASLPAATYTWSKDGSPLVGVTNTYTIDGSSTSQTGLYKVAVYDGCMTKNITSFVNVLEDISLSTSSLLTTDLCEGEDLNLRVIGSGVDLSYNWYKTIAPATSLSTDENLSKLDMLAGDTGIYRCDLTSASGCNTDFIEFTVNVRKHATVDKPLDVSICQDTGDASFDVIATGNGTLEYKWYENDALIYTGPISELLIPSLLTNDGKSYHCVVKGDYCDEAVSEKAVLTVKKNIIIAQSPTSQTVVENGTVSFTVAVSGTGPYIYQWFKDGVIMDNVVYPSAKTETLELTNVPLSDTDSKYYCVVSGSCEPATSAEATLTVIDDYRISLNPENAEICIGDEFTFVVEYNTDTDACVWQYREVDTDPFVDITAGIGSYTFTSTKSILTITSSPTDMSAWTFRALVKRSVFVDDVSKIVRVIVHKPATFADILDKEICKTSGVSFDKKKLTGTGTYSYEWKKGTTTQPVNTSIFNLEASDDSNGNYSVQVSDGFCSYPVDEFNISHYADLVIDGITDIDPVCENVPDDLVVSITKDASLPAATYTWSKDGGPLVGATNTYNIDGSSTLQTGLYKVAVYDGCLTKSISSFVNVLEDISLSTTSPLTSNLCEGEDLNLHVTGSGVDLSYNWYKLPDLGTSLLLGEKFDKTNLSVPDAGVYRCVLTSASDCNTDFIDFTVNVQEKLGLNPLATNTICEDSGSSDFVITKSKGTPTSYQWYNNAGEMSGETGSTLSVDNVLANNGQNYYCIVGGTCNSVESNKALFTVNENVTITSHPGNQTINEMGSATFTVDARGTNLSYQWYENGASMGNTPASAQTNTLSLTSVPLSYNGYKYKCEVTGLCDTKTSTEAILTVIKENRILVQAENAVVCKDDKFTFEVQYKNTPNTNCVWEYDSGSGYVDASGLGIVDNDATSSTLKLTATVPMNTWSFKAIVKRTGYEDNVSNEVGVRVDVPASFELIADAQICNGSGASFSINGLSGSTPHTYTWTEGARDFGTNSSLSLTAAEATDGTYTVGVTAGVCPAFTETFDISHYPDLVLKDLVHDNTLCPEGKIDLTVETEIGSSVPETYVWSKDGSDIVGATTVSYEKLDVTDSESGLYKVTVEDKCMIQSKSIRIDVLDVVVKTDTWIDKELCSGDALLFEAIVSGDNPKYTWKVPTGVTDPGNVFTYKIDAVTEANEGTYECSVQGTCGAPVVYSANVLVDSIPNITTDLNLSAVCVGEELQLGPIAYEATNETITWKFEDVVIPGVNGLSLDLGTADLDLSEEGKYRVEVSNDCGVDYSIGYQDISPLPTLEPIADQTACQGEDVVFRAVTTGEGLTYNWFFDDIAVPAFNDQSEFIISDIQPIDVFTPWNHKVECRVSSCGEELSEITHVLVNPTTILNTSIKGDVKYVGENYTFDFDVTGSNLKFEWHHINTLGFDAILGEELTKTLTINDLSMDDAGEYYCIITGDCGVRYTRGYLTVKNPLKVISGLGTTDIKKCQGDPLNLNISVEGEVFDIEWYKVRGEIKTPLGHKELNYSISSLAVADAGTYSCVIVGEGLTVTETVDVFVYPNTVLNSALKDKTLCEKETLSWSTDVSGVDLTYTWQNEGKIIFTSTTSSKLLIDNVQLDTAGLYIVDVTGRCGDVRTQANLTVKSLPQFISQSDNLDKCENDDEAIFTVIFTGDDLVYQWQKDGVDIEGANSTELKIQNLRVDDAGDYTCIASSSCGNATSLVMKLDVTPQLRILSETPGMDICDGLDALFGIEVEGHDVVYQWQKDGVDMTNNDSISGVNTSQLTISPTDSKREGYYSCSVTDKCTSTDRYSNSKKLTINPLPNSSISGRMVLCVLEDRVAYSTVVQPNINYGWLVNGGEFTTPAEGLRTKVTWGDVVDGNYLNLIITNEATGCSSKFKAPVTLRPLPEVDLAPFRTYGICEVNIDLNKGIVNGETEEGGIYWIDGVAENEFIPSERGNGEYQVRYSYTDKYGCSNTSKEFVLTVDSLPIVKIMDDLTVGTCETKELSAITEEDNIKWSPALYLDDRESMTPTFKAGESTLYVAEVTDKYGCIGNDFINVTVAPLPTITTINDTIIGECKEIELTTVISGDIEEISWTNPGDLDEPDNSNPMLINRQVGVTDYQINVTDKYGCVASGSVQVEVLPNPEVGEDKNLCEGETLFIDTKNLSNPVWSDGYSAWERTIDKPGEYELSVEQNDCKLSQKIVMNPTPRFKLDNTIQPGIVIFQGQTVTLDPNLNPDYSPYEYDWSDGSVLSQLDVSESGVYKLKVQDKFGCVATDTVEVLVKPIGIESPDAFTPLSDNENDRFYLKDINVTDDFEMYIYNRWGELLYKTDNAGYAGGWDGTYKGKDCPVGTYVWIIFLDGKERGKGTVTLLR